MNNMREYVKTGLAIPLPPLRGGGYHASQKGEEVQMNFDLTEDRRAFHEAAYDFAVDDWAPHSAERDRHHIFPAETLRKAAWSR